MNESGSAARVRLFVALELPETVKERIASAQERLRGGLRSGSIKWTTPDQFHLTLQFLGHLDARCVPDLLQTLEKACGPLPPFPLTARSVGFFPNPRRPRVLWVAVEDTAGQLRDLAHAVRNAMLPFVPEPETREFSGHITLARIRDWDRAATTALTQCAQGHAKDEYGSWTAGEVVLMRSQLSPKGSTYFKEGTARLRPENT